MINSYLVLAKVLLLLCYSQICFSSSSLKVEEYVTYKTVRPDTVPVALCGGDCAIDIYVGQSNAGRTFNNYVSARDTFLANLGSYTGNWDCVTSAATGATAISLHLPGGQLFAANDSILRAAMDGKLASGCSTVYPTIHWWQGESDTTPAGALAYPGNFNQIYTYYTSLFGANFRMFIYEVNNDLVPYDDDINNFFISFASQNNNVTFVAMPSNVTYNNPPLNNHPSTSVLQDLLDNHFSNKLAGDCGTPWTGYPATATVNVRSDIWDDLDGDGRQDISEPPVAGVTVRLLDINNAIVATSVSDANGLVLFNDVPQSATLSMKYILPTNYAFTQKGIGPNFQIDSDINPHNGKSDYFATGNTTSVISNIDCGLLSPSAVETRVWDDLDGDGRQDNGEPNLANITVNLLNVSNQVISSVTTGTDGLAIFTDLVANNIYKTEIIKPSILYVFALKNVGLNEQVDSDINRSTGISDFIIPTKGAEILDHIDAGIWSPGEIETYVWDDLDGDSRQDAIEQGISNITVELYDLSNNLLATMLSDTNGLATFSSLQADQSYRLKYVTPPGYVFATKDNGSDLIDSDASATTGLSPIIRLTQGNQVVSNVDAGLYPPNSIIETYVWDDQDGDGRQDVNEPPLENMVVELQSTIGTVLESKSTDIAGIASFTGLSSNTTYRLRYSLPQDYRVTTFKTSSRHLDSDANRISGTTGPIVLESGTNVIDDIDAGFWTPGYMEAYVWYDDNLDGIQNNNENPFENVYVELRNANNSLISSTFSDANGLAIFYDVPADRNLRLYVEEPIGYKPTTINAGTNDSKDSDIGIATGISPLIKPIKGNQQYLNWDAGFKLDPSMLQIGQEENGQVYLLTDAQDIVLNIAPNPVTDIISFDYSGLRSEAALRMFTIEGQLVYEVSLAEGSYQHTESLLDYQLNSGIYIVRLSDKHQSTSQLLVISR